MRNLKFIYLFLLIFINAYTQEKLIPVNSQIKDPDLEEFIVNLRNAIAVKDKEFIINNLSPKIQNGFGGGGGVEEFKEYWNYLSDKSFFWRLAKNIFEMGGGELNEEGNFYSMPYVFSNWPDHEVYDVYEYMAITAAKVNVFNEPNASNSKVLGQLSYDIVKVDYEKSYPPFINHEYEYLTRMGEKLWYYIISLDKKLEGYVYRDYIWSPIGYRIGFCKKNGKWSVSYFLANY